MIHTMYPGTQSRRVLGFTLVELLVVIGIISALIAILLPALQKAKQAALAVQCASNQRQLYMTLQTYASEYNNGKFLPCRGKYNPPSGAETMWPYWIRTFPLIKNWSYIYCPAWEPLAMLTASPNCYGYRDRDDKGAGYKSFAIPHMLSSEFPLFADSVSIYSTALQAACMGNFTSGVHLRHNREANVCFGDGHVARVTYVDIMDGTGVVNGVNLWGPFRSVLPKY